MFPATKTIFITSVLALVDPTRISSHSTAACGSMKSNGVDLEELNVPPQMMPTRCISGAEPGDVIGTISVHYFIINRRNSSFGSLLWLQLPEGQKIALFSIYHSQGSSPFFPFPALKDQSKNTATNLKPIGFPLTLVTAITAPQDGQPLIKFPPRLSAFLSLSFWVYILFLYRFPVLTMHRKSKQSCLFFLLSIPNLRWGMLQEFWKKTHFRVSLKSK